MLEIGSLVDGKYKVLRVVGQGGMSVVYQAVNEKANKIWAIKEVRKDGVQNFEVVKQNLIVETELLKRFNHPNLPSIIDVIDTEDAFLIVMDYIEGNSLSKALEENGAQDQEDVVEWSKQLCDVLGYLHSRKPPIIYRDMKPANVMLKPDGNISLIDFGTAREFKSSSVEDTTCLGTQGYAAPEQYGGHGQTDARTDIYCLGATMYHLVTGHNPSMPPYEMYPIRQWNPALSSGLEQIIIKCTQRNPEDRYQNCAELMYDLEHYRDLDIENQKTQKKRWKGFLICAILTLVFALGAVGLKIGENISKASTYDGLIEDVLYKASQPGKEGTDGTEKYKEEIAMLDKAIKLEPGNTKAYSELLKLYKNEGDWFLSGKEYIDLSTKVYSHRNEIKEKDKEAYAQLAKEIADASFLAVDQDGETSGYENANTWYDRVLETGKDDQLIKETKLRNTIVKSWVDKDKSGLTLEGNETGIETPYADLFEMLSTFVNDRDMDNENIVIRLRGYKTVSNILFTKDYEFLKVVDKDRFNELVNTLSQKITQIENSEQYVSNIDKYNRYLETMLNGTKEEIEKMQEGKSNAGK